MYTLKANLHIYIFLVGLFGLIYTRNQPKTYWWKTFPYFLILVGILDGFGAYVYKLFPKVAPYYFNLFVIPFQMMYYMWLLNKNISNTKRYYYISLFICASVVILENTPPLFAQTSLFPSLAFSIGNLLLLGHILRYFYQLSNSDKILNFYHQKMFWVSSGLLIFWLGSLPFYGLFAYLYENYPQIFMYYYPFVLAFNYIMYTCFLVSFIWGKKD